MQFEPKQLPNALAVMALLGYVKGVAGGRKIFRGQIGNVELAIQEVLDFANPKVVRERFVEVEYMGETHDETAAENDLRSFLSARGISSFTIEEWNAYVKSLNERWNGVYVHGETSPDVIRALGS